MGQRFQAYVAFTYDSERGDPDSEGSFQTQIVGLHHRWCWGIRAATATLRLMHFIQEPDDSGAWMTPFNPKSYANNAAVCGEILKNVFSLHPEEKYWSPTDLFDDEPSRQYCENPLDAIHGNNNGIVIVDACDVQRVRYCFMRLDRMECGFGRLPRSLSPLSVTQWLDFYYPPPDRRAGLPAKDLEELRSFRFRGTQKRSALLKKKFEPFPVLTRAEVRKLFPKMYEKEPDARDLARLKTYTR